MSVQWIKDVDTGELYPVQNDFDYEPPAHLEIPEYQTVDYYKTRQMIIEQLQNQLIAAQNHIEAIENEKTSDDNNSIETVNDVSAENVSRSEMRLNSDVNYEGKSESFDFLASLKFVGLILLVCSLFAMGIYVFPKLKDIEINIPNVSEQQTVDYEVSPFYEIGSIPIYSSEQGISLYLNRKEQEQPQERQETEQKQSDKEVLQNGIDYIISRLSNLIAPLIAILFSFFVINLVIKFMRINM